MASQALRLPRTNETPLACTEDRIEGGFRSISVHQLTMAWWLYRDGFITRRQLRVYFAAHEMAARRTASEQGRKRARFGVEEVSFLVGGKGAPEAIVALSGDLKRLSKLGLVRVGLSSIDFAVSVDQIAVDDHSGFWTMFNQMPHSRRNVPVPRRTLRSLAAGYSRAATAVMLAMLIRSLFWHRETGRYRMDGRTKGTWIAETFGISRRAVTEGRAKLIEIGWLAPIDTAQWQLNRWGSHDTINADWTSEAGQGASSKSASPSAKFPTKSASPDLNSSPFPSGKTKNTRTPERPDLAGVKNNSGKAKSAVHNGSGPNLRNVQAEHLARTEDLLKLHSQAVEAGLIDSSEASQLDFLSFAERARAHGSRPGALFMWLLRGRKTQFVTQADEDAAHARLREHRNRQAQQSTLLVAERVAAPRELSGDERFYLLCVQIARQQRVNDPFMVAFVGKKWTRDHWEEVKMGYETWQQHGQTPIQWHRLRSV